MNKRKWLVPIALLVVNTQPVHAQERHTLALVGAFQGYKFPKELSGVTSATLAIVPIGYELHVSRALSLDFYSAFARGDVKDAQKTYTMQGLVDTRVRASLNVTPWAVLTGALNLPTGNATHDASEAIVATSLSTELLGFREALWGTGFGATTGIATAWRAGSTGIGFGASYRMQSEFEPSADSAFKYAPGNEARARVAIDQNVGSNSKVTLGLTFQNYSDDQLDGRNLFAPGNRWRGDIAYSFRGGVNSTWSIYAADVRRENGDVSLQLVDGAGRPVRDSTFSAGQQNMVVVGIAGASRGLRPSADFRLLTRQSGAGEGWLAGAGTDLPIRRGGTDVIPNFRLSYGQMEGGNNDIKHSFWGGEVSLTLRWAGGR